LDYKNFLLAISFNILAKSGFYLVIFKEALGVALTCLLFVGAHCRMTEKTPSQAFMQLEQMLDMDGSTF
jgi:hypothetical protein